MTALQSRRRLDALAAESVDDLSQLKQIVEPAQIPTAVASVCVERSLRRFPTPICPIGRNERSAAVRQDHQNERDAAPPDAADHRQRLAFERMAFTGDSHRIRDIKTTGSLWPLPSTPSRTGN